MSADVVVFLVLLCLMSTAVLEVIVKHAPNSPIPPRITTFLSNGAILLAFLTSGWWIVQAYV